MSFSILDVLISQLVYAKMDLVKFTELYEMILINEVNVVQMMLKSGKPYPEIDTEIGINNLTIHIIQLKLENYIGKDYDLIGLLLSNPSFCHIPDPDYLLSVLQIQTVITEESVTEMWDSARLIS